MELPDPFFRRDPFIPSKFGVLPLPVASAGDEASSSDLVFLLRLESLLSKFLRGDFFDFIGSFSRALLWLPSPPLLDLALHLFAVFSNGGSRFPLVLSVAFSTSLILLPPVLIEVPSGFDVDFLLIPPLVAL